MGHRTQLRRASLTVAGMLIGLVTLLIAFLVLSRVVRVDVVRQALEVELGLPADVFEVEAVTHARQVRVALRDVLLLDAAGDTVVAAPRVRMVFDARSTAPGRPLEFTDVELTDPFFNLRQAPGGSWNFAQVTRATVAGRPVAGAADPNAGVVFRGVTVAGGRLRLATPADGTLATRSATGIAGRLSQIRLGGATPWHVSVEHLQARLHDPEIQLVRLAGMAEAAREGGIRFALEELRTDRSRLTADGLIDPTPAGTRIRIAGRAPHLDFRDLQWVLPQVPAEGSASFAFSVTAAPGERTAIRLEELTATAFESRVTGQATVLMGLGRPLGLRDTRLLLDPLQLIDLERLGLVDELPLLGTLHGTVSSPPGEVALEDGVAVLDVVATLTPREAPGAEPSVVTAEGRVALDAELGWRMDEVRLELRPLRLATVRALLDEAPEMLRGTVRGGVTVSGGPAGLSLQRGSLLYEVGDAPPTRLAALEGTITLQPALAYDVSAVAQPLALATLTELVPALPFRQAELSGPIRLFGDAQGVRFEVDLSGAAGGLAASGAMRLGDDPVFDVEGRLRAFQVATLLTRGLALEGPVSGTFAAQGRFSDFGFAVDLTQAVGRFVLDGRVRRPAGELQLDAEGRLESFRLGILVGRPGMFVAPLTGPITLSGGGRQPFHLRADLAGPGARLDVSGWLDPTGVPSYALAGAVQGLNLQRALADLRLPATSVRGTFDIEGRGMSPETLEGRYAVDLSGSTAAGLPVSLALDARAGGGILQVQQLDLTLPRTQLAAAGSWGLTRPAPQPLRFSLASTDLRQLAPLLAATRGIEPRLSGSVQAEGEVAGTVSHPILTLALRGRNLRYEEWRAATLTLNLDGARLPQGIAGEGALFAENVALPGGETLQTVRAELSAEPGTVGVGVVARRDRDTDLAASARVQVADGRIAGVLLESLLLRVEGTPWQLTRPSFVAWDPQAGARIEGLELVRAGPDPGLIAASGVLPLEGEADLRIELSRVDLDDLRRVLRQAPDVGGRLTATVVLAGPVAAPDFEVQGYVEELRVPDLTLSRVDLHARYTGTTLDATLQAWQNDTELVLAEASLPMNISVVGAVPRFEMIDDAPLGGAVRADSLPLALVATFVPGVERGEGYAVADIRIQGTHDRPRFAGSFEVRDGAIFVEPLGVRFQEIEARIATEGDLVRIDSLSVRSGGLALVRGEILLDDRQHPHFSLAATMSRFQAIRRPDVAVATTSGSLGLEGRFPSPVLTGQLTINDGTIPFPAAPRASPIDMADADVGLIGTDTIATPRGAGGLFAGVQIEGLEVEAGEAVWLTSEDARIQLAGDLLVFRAGEDLRIYGELQTVRGTYTLRMGPIAREFDIQRGRIQFFGTPDINPALDIVAANRVRVLSTGGPQVITILVAVRGTLQQLQLELTSDTRPPLPEGELLSLLIFGRPSHELGEQAGALAQEIFIQELLGGAVLGPLEQALLGAGIFDYVRIRSRPVGAMEIFTAPTGVLGTTAIEGGRQLLPNLFWTLEVGVGLLGGADATGASGTTWGTSLDWQVTPEWGVRWAYEPLRRDPLLQRASRAPSHQMIFDVRRRWEFGFPPDPTPEQLPDDPVDLVPPLPPPDRVPLSDPERLPGGSPE
jgi:hypothetical protein